MIWGMRMDKRKELERIIDTSGLSEEQILNLWLQWFGEKVG